MEYTEEMKRVAEEAALKVADAEFSAQLAQLTQNMVDLRERLNRVGAP